MRLRSVWLRKILTVIGKLYWAAFLGGGMFNDGSMHIFRVMNDLAQQIGPEYKTFADNYDHNRIQRKG